MAGIPEATPIVLTADEQAELEELTRSTKTEYRLRQRAQIVLLAAKGVASRAIGRKVGCTTGTASGALCARPSCRAGRDRRPRRRAQIHGRDQQTDSCGARPASAGGTRTLDRSADRSGTGRR